MATIAFRVNGEPRELEAAGDRALLEVLREDLALTGTKYGCGEAQCGACSVLLDGRRDRSHLFQHDVPSIRALLHPSHRKRRGRASHGQHRRIGAHRPRATDHTRDRLRDLRDGAFKQRPVVVINVCLHAARFDFRV